jgi:hypothetical protein
MRIFSSADAGGSDAECPSALALPALCWARISVSSSLLAATMNQKSSLPEVPQLVSQVLTGNNQPLALIEMRRQITTLRSRHSENLLVTYLLNSFLIKVASLTKPENAAHAESLRDAFNSTLAEVKKSLARNNRKSAP